MVRKEFFMKQKKKIWFYIIGTFLLAFPFHFGYDIFPNPVNAIFFPVNESIWEHMKMLFTAYLWFGVIEYPLLKHFRQDTKNEWFALWICSLLIIPIFLLLFLPIYSIIGEQMIVTIVLMFIAIAITKWIQFHLLEHVQDYRNLNILTLILVVISYVIFALLTFYPPRASLFRDPQNDTYGITEKR